MKFRYLALFVILVQLELSAIEPLTVAAHAQNGAPSPSPAAAAPGLSEDFYSDTCPDVVDIIEQKVGEWIQKDSTLAPSILRLHFHDCAVRGCDASILLNFNGSERTASTSTTLRGFQVIDDIKAALEKSCPRTVSCADILAAAAREATLLITDGPFWPVPFGRKDGRISIDEEAEMVPHGHEDVTTLINFFESIGLDMQDLVTLSGAHTVGRASCGSFLNRLHNFEGTGKPDPSLNTTYLQLLKNKCRRTTDLVHFDVTTPTTFDNVFYKNLQNKEGLLTTDQELISDRRTAPFVETMASKPFIFGSDFSDAMVKLGNVQVLTGNEGEVRVNCNFVNPR